MNEPALVPELYVTELSRSLRFYLDLIGFTVEYERPEERFAALSLGDARLMLEEAPSLGAASPAELARGEWRTAALEHPFGRGVNLQVRVPDVVRIAERFSASGQVMLLTPYEKSYRVRSESVRVRQMLALDPDGYLIRPSQRLD